ncbi:MAG TPA: glycosyltransferase [Desulfobacteraceae bacterium]|nr:glycosyltransferase [Desulfobacteraceae bacterium]
MKRDTLSIGLLHYSIPPVVGGVEEIINNHASVLYRLGHSISILAGMGEDFNDNYDIRIETLLSSRAPQIIELHERCRKTNSDDLERVVDEIFNIIQDWAEGLDIIVAHNVLHMHFNLALTYALHRFADMGGNPPIISWAHDSPYFRADCPEYLHNPPWDILKKVSPNIHYVTISNSRRALFKRYIDADWKVIPNGIDPLGLFYIDERSLRLATELNIFERDIVFVQPARITPRKNLELSIHIIREIKRQGYDVLLILTGAYDPHESKAVSYHRRLKYWIETLDLNGNIAILAEYRFKDGKRLVPDRIFIRDLYILADMLLMTSKEEGFGLPLLEAGVMKLPIACSTIAPFKEIGEGVCFFDLNESPKEIACRILDYLSKINTHPMFRKVMRNYVLDSILKNVFIPYVADIIKEKR